ncbi:hypothetical protein KO500_12945 [Cellulophaga baltica]|uniref:histidine kinase dimerization/phosphoacceptor domain -containing protein n=1 Tax=Cellulophaga TaxID=104264 RepID=UPI001C07DFA8|nr:MULTISPECIES: histidine kinase dimerization/phosphoacceptor domain -containing protein [Cellulophaga]MBU2997347.1 hypothetical protein [Cellulophaga baltica]MDO6768745.1 histidine kinase dimerization/phosphoacceptor domain -containing protein [Cellulophaga sp. 1_MG-2023]
MSKRLVVISVIVFLILSVAIWCVYIHRLESFKQNVYKIEAAQSYNDLESADILLNNLYVNSRKTVMFLYYLTEHVFNENNSVSKTKENFFYFLKSDPNYFQARIIDNNGLEIIKTENVNNNISVYTDDKLQNKKNRYYFQETINLKKGQFYVSDLDLNVENEQIEKPYRPTIRFFTPFFDKKNTPIGVLGVNLNASSWIKKLSHRNTTILNSKDEVFFSTDKNEELYTLSKKDLDTKDEHGFPMYLSKTISLEGNNRWTIYSTLDAIKIKKKISDYKNNTIVISLSLNIGILFFLYIISNLYYKNKRISLLNTSVSARLEERDTLLKEIHHRVKNNLQVVTSLLNLQSRYIIDPDVKSMLRYSQYRIQSMALLHETLYKSEDLSKINYANYLSQLVNGLIVSMKGSNNKIGLELDIDDVFFNIDTSIPLGLVINEIITNSLKYAFPNDEGIISIELKKLNNENYLLKIGDNGKGIPESISFRTTNTLGLKLVHKLVLQLQGNIEKDSTKTGTNYIIMFEEIQELS